MQHLTEAQLQRLHGWRRGVVRLWLVTMAAALALWAITAALAPGPAAQGVLGLVLVVLVLAAALNMRRGKCPSCGARIRFAPRIELPPACSRCGASFVAAEEIGG